MIMIITWDVRLIWKMEFQCSGFFLLVHILYLWCIWCCPSQLFLLQPMGTYCGALPKANVESCVGCLLGCAPASPLSHPPARSGGQHTITMGGVRTHIGALHMSRNPHSLHFDWVWIAHQTCWSPFLLTLVRVLALGFITPLSSLVPKPVHIHVLKIKNGWSFFWADHHHLCSSFLHWAWHWLQPPCLLLIGEQCVG